MSYLKLRQRRNKEYNNINKNNIKQSQNSFDIIYSLRFDMEFNINDGNLKSFQNLVTGYRKSRHVTIPLENEVD